MILKMVLYLHLELGDMTIHIIKIIIKMSVVYIFDALSKTSSQTVLRKHLFHLDGSLHFDPPFCTKVVLITFNLLNI